MRRIAMQGEGVAGTLTAVPDVAGAPASSPRGLAQERVARADASLAEPRGGVGIDREARQTADGDSPQSREGVVARLFEAFSRRDLLSVLPLMHAEVVFQPMTAEVTRAGEPYRGHAGIRSYVEDIETHWRELTVQPAQIRAAGRAVVVLGLASGSGAAGAFENAPTTWVIKFKNDLVYEVQIFSDARHVVGALVGEDGN